MLFLYITLKNRQVLGKCISEIIMTDNPFNKKSVDPLKVRWMQHRGETEWGCASLLENFWEKGHIWAPFYVFTMIYDWVEQKIFLNRETHPLKIG